jgi:hypothetical protein
VAVGHTVSAELATVGARWKVGSGKVRVPLASKLASQLVWLRLLTGRLQPVSVLPASSPQLLGTTSRYMHARWYLPNQNGGLHTAVPVLQSRKELLHLLRKTHLGLRSVCLVV